MYLFKGMPFRPRERLAQQVMESGGMNTKGARLAQTHLLSYIIMSVLPFESSSVGLKVNKNTGSTSCSTMYLLLLLQLFRKANKSWSQNYYLKIHYKQILCFFSKANIIFSYVLW